MRQTSWLTLLLLGAALSACQTKTAVQEAMARKAAEIHARVFTVDTHIDWPSRQQRQPDFNPAVRHDPASLASGQWDLPRMVEGGLDGVFMSIFTAQGPRTDEGHAAAKAHAEELIELTTEMINNNSDSVELALTAEDALRLEKDGKRAIFMGMENGYPLGHDLQNVKYFYNLGVRYITLTHTRNNDLGDSSTDEKQEFGGLSPLGEQVVQEMNRLGIMVDISHVHDDTFWDVMKLTRAPVIASHSSARALCDHPRNMSDDMLKAVADNGGVVQLCLLSNYIKQFPPNAERDSTMRAMRSRMRQYFSGGMDEDEQAAFEKEFKELRDKFPRATLQDAVDHIDHMVKVMGVDHVGIGSDFDGGGGLTGIEEVSKIPELTKELLKRGYSEEDIRKIWGGNLLRVMAAAEKVAAQLQGANNAAL